MNKITFIKSYLKKHFKVFIRFTVLICFLCLSFTLYGLPLEAVIYPIVVSLIVDALILMFDIKQEYQKYLQLNNLNILLEDTYCDLPMSKDIEINEYIRLINDLLKQKKTITDEAKDAYSQMIEYYNTWTHQIKIPIASLKLKLEDKDENIDLLSDLNRIEQYVKMAITYLKLDNRDLDFIFRKINLDDIIKETIRKFSNDFIAKKIKLDYKPINRKVLSDEMWLCFVLEQLLSNSLKYTKKGCISIYLDEEEKLCVSDTGIGISASDLPRVFERGYTGFNGRNNKTASGIGLYLCKRILDKLNIGIEISSKINEGTIVKLKFNNDKINFE